jgi:hypothetical protein
MKMSSSLPGIAISHSEVTGIHTTGFWLLVDDVEYFVPFDDYPVFREATVGQIYAVQRLGPTQFHWPELDADIELEALEHPEQYPLLFRPTRPSHGYEQVRHQRVAVREALNHESEE